MTPERREENAHGQGPEGTPRGSVHKPRALEKVALPLWGCFSRSRNEGAGPQKPCGSSHALRRAPQTARRLLYPWGPGRRGPGGERRGGAGARGAQEHLSPRTRSPRHGRATPSTRATLVPTVGAAAQLMAASQGASVPCRTVARNVPQGLSSRTAHIRPRLPSRCQHWR